MAESRRITFRRPALATADYEVLLDGEVIGTVTKVQESFTGMRRGGTYTYWRPETVAGEGLTQRGAWDVRTFEVFRQWHGARPWRTSTRKDAAEALRIFRDGRDG